MVEQDTDARPVDVSILYGLGMEDRAQHIARELRTVRYIIGGEERTLSDEEIERFRDKVGGLK